VGSLISVSLHVTVESDGERILKIGQLSFGEVMGKVGCPVFFYLRGIVELC